MPYEPMIDPKTNSPLPGEENFAGLPMLRVAKQKRQIRAAQGDMHALEQIENRIEGKPRQQVEQLNINASLSDYLAQLHALEEPEQVTATVIERDILDGI